MKKEIEKFNKITEQEWYQFLMEKHIDPDYWCDYVPEDYGFTIKEEILW